LSTTREADETVAFVEEPENADRNVIEPDEPADEENSTDAANDDESPDVGLVESDHETGLTDGLDRPRVRAPDEKIRMGTSKVDKDTADEFGAGLRDRGATVEDHSITAPLSAYNNQVKESTAIPTMSVLPEAEQVVIGEDDEMILVATNEPTPEVLDHCLETIEDYIETVQNHGHTQSEIAVMAQMYEAFLYGFWAPFANQYAEALSSPSRTLDNVLQHLYIEGKSDAGKDKLTEYILRLVSDNTVISGVDADDVGVKRSAASANGTRASRTPSSTPKKEDPAVEPDPKLLGRLDTHQRRSAVPHLHDQRRAPEIRVPEPNENPEHGRLLPSNPEDPGFREAQKDLSEVLERQNPIFSYVARRMLTEQPWTDGNGTIEDVRRIVREFYDEADRKQPEYFPADEPAEKTYDTGRLKWQRDIQGGRVTFESEPNAITADFDRDEYEVYDYEKRLPKRFMSEKSSTSVYIGAPEEFAEWIGYSVNELLNGAARNRHGYRAVSKHRKRIGYGQLRRILFLDCSGTNLLDSPSNFCRVLHETQRLLGQLVAIR